MIVSYAAIENQYIDSLYKNSIAFLYMSNKQNLKKILPLTIAQNIKYLGINLIKDCKTHLYTES